MKKITLTLFTLLFISSPSQAIDEPIDPDTARAYEGYLVTFIWPDDKTSEQIDYKNILTTQGLFRLPETAPDGSEPLQGAPTTEAEMLEDEPISQPGLPTPLIKIAEKLGPHVRVLLNQQWTLIFKRPGDIIEKSFHSDEIKDGYPELTGDIRIKLGRYLESEIQYKHFLFDSFTQPDTSMPIEKNQNSLFFSNQESNQGEQANTRDLKAFEPALVLALDMRNKTASKKLNYLDHPTIGTLLYFQPLELEEAVEKIALQTMSPETGQSLTFDTLNSTNELTRPQAITAPVQIAPSE
ncbi:hypothetical protein [Marinomonas posidonica]|uniref:Peptidoglycan-binding protein CsiV n=1 Tax=Marinomonas posidonica (strain CECT 7376 / NCIMB 14433 / IVIA-Po-181) TaxID=491952 RepID=F6CTM5_MARPP|nr:hypothetical protein [Marinomonas posidonica]AEF55140.1 hypothetical protein Mar181_2102 [Marinomonas posidonica IVIA-Po-181]